MLSTATVCQQMEIQTQVEIETGKKCEEKHREVMAALDACKTYDQCTGTQNYVKGTNPEATAQKLCMGEEVKKAHECPASITAVCA